MGVGGAGSRDSKGQGPQPEAGLQSAAEAVRVGPALPAPGTAVRSGRGEQADPAGGHDSNERDPCAAFPRGRREPWRRESWGWRRAVKSKRLRKTFDLLLLGKERCGLLQRRVPAPGGGGALPGLALPNEAVALGRDLGVEYPVHSPCEPWEMLEPHPIFLFSIQNSFPISYLNTMQVQGSKRK